MSDDLLTPENALLLAAEALAKAQRVAVYNRDTETLLSIAAGWMELYERMKDEDVEPKGNIGFGGFRKAKDDESYG